MDQDTKTTHKPLSTFFMHMIMQLWKFVWIGPDAHSFRTIRCLVTRFLFLLPRDITCGAAFEKYLGKVVTILFYLYHSLNVKQR